MNINELSSGIYKIRHKNKLHLLRVQGYGEKRTYFIDHDLLGASPKTMSDDYEVISRCTGPPKIDNCMITLSFNDSDKDKFEFSVKDAWALKNVFNELEWLQTPFGYTPKKSK